MRKLRFLGALLSLAWAAGALGAQQQKQGGKPQGGPGRYEGELRDKQGVMMRVSMQAPMHLPPTRSLGLLLVHHGMNGNENNYIGGTLECVKRLKLDEEYVVISGKSKGGGWTLEDDGPLTLRVIEWAKASYPVDPRKVYIWGSSNGAGYIGRFGWAHQDIVAGAVGYCGGYNFQPAGGKAEKVGDGKTEWYFVHGGNDNPQNSGNAAKQLQSMGYRAVFRQLDGYGHTDIWDGNGHPDKTVVDACREDYMLWIHALRHKEVEPEKKDKEWLAKFENASTAESLFGSKSTFLNLARIGGLQGGAPVAMALQAKSATARASAAEACEKASFGKAVCDELAKCALNDESDRVQQMALKALAVYANWHYPEAIEGLCQAALRKGESKSSIGDRLLAVEGLAIAAKLAALGNFEDKKLWWTLVHLLEDDEVRLRAGAFAALSKASKDVFGYVPGAISSARKDAAAKWQSWCAQKYGPAEK